MANRFSDIRRGARLKEALDNYQAYLARPVSTTLPTYKAREAPRALQLTPFGLTLPTGTFALVNGQETGYTRLGATLNALGQVEPATANANQIIGFQPARVVTFENATKTLSGSPTSKYTGLPYRKYTGDRFSCPFGQRAATDKEIDVANEIKATLKARTALEVNRVSITPERQKAR